MVQNPGQVLQLWMPLAQSHTRDQSHKPLQPAARRTHPSDPETLQRSPLFLLPSPPRQGSGRLPSQGSPGIEVFRSELLEFYTFPELRFPEALAAEGVCVT